MPNFSDWPDDKLSRAISEESAVLQALQAELARRKPLHIPTTTVEKVVQVVDSICWGTVEQVRKRIRLSSIDDVRQKLDEAVCLALITVKNETYYSLKHPPKGQSNGTQ